jgi:phenylacetic acid degradation operon negative regulatory protein
MTETSNALRDAPESRTLTARSVLASTLLGTDPPELPVARLVAVAQLFGVTQNSARVALSRMAAAGEVTQVDGRYRLAGHLLARRERQEQSRSPEFVQWDGSWAVVVVVAPRRDAAHRTSARRTFLAARLAELREGVWMRPANLPVPLPDDVSAGVERLTARPAAEPATLAARLWDLDAWAAGAKTLRERLASTLPRLVDDQALAPGFVLSADVLRHLQADPLLPPDLLPPDWPGPSLRADYDEWDARYRRLLREYHHRVGAVGDP